MKISLLTVPIVLSCLLPHGAAAQSAYNYPICGVYQDRSGATSCYFATYQQCAETVGHQGFCRSNPAYVGPASAQTSRRVSRRHRRAR